MNLRGLGMGLLATTLVACSPAEKVTDSTKEKVSSAVQPERVYTEEEKLEHTIQFYIDKRKAEGGADPVEEQLKRLRAQAKEGNTEKK